MQSLPEVWDKGIEIDVFNGYTDGIVPVVSSPSFCLTDKQPIGSLVTGTLKALPFDKGFEQVNGMSVFVYEIVSDAAGNESKNVTCQMGDTHPWKNKKTLVVGDEVETLFSGLCFPVDERVTGCNLPGRGAKEGASNGGVITVEDNILHIFTRRPAVTKIMVKRK